MRNLGFRLWAALVAWLLAGTSPLAAADYRHDLYLCVLQSGQAAVMGSRSPVPSGLFRSSDRQKIDHVGVAHIRMFKVFPDPVAPNGLYLTALNGVLHSLDRGQTWRILTSWDMTEPKGFALDPHAPGHIYAGLPDGIGVSRDYGATWKRMNEGIKRRFTFTMTADRTRAGRVLAGTELGIFLTEDGAKTWRLVQATEDVTYDLQQSPHDPKIFFAVTSADGALWSQDGGVSWTRMAGVPREHTLHFGVFDPNHRERLALCGWEAGVRISEDGGKTWVDRTAGLPNRQVWSVAIDPDFPSRLYAAPYQDAVFVSDDFGRNWRRLFFEKTTVYSMSFIPRR